MLTRGPPDCLPCVSGTWMLTRSGPRPLLPLDLRSVFGEPGSPAWLCLLTLMCCTHLDGRTLFITLTSGQVRHSPMTMRRVGMRR